MKNEQVNCKFYYFNVYKYQYLMREKKYRNHCGNERDVIVGTCRSPNTKSLNLSKIKRG